MFDFSFGKLILIFALCLIVLGPEKLPKLAAQLGRFAGQARAMARHFRSQLEQEIAAEDLKKELREADAAIAKMVAQTSPIQSAVTEATNSIDAHVSGMQAAVEAATSLDDKLNVKDTVSPLDPAHVETALVETPNAVVTPDSPPLSATTQIVADKTTTHPAA